MEKINKQIDQTKGNPGLIHQVFEELEQQLELNLVEQEKFHAKIPELKYLWDQCGHTDYSVAFEACQCVVNLTLKGQLGINESITALISNVSTAKHYSLLTDAVTELMLRGSCKDIRHPFISLFEMQQDTWPFIFQQISTIVSNSSLDLQALNQIKPFVIYGLCYGSIESRSSLWNMLQGKLYHEDSRPIVCWILESFFWQQQVSSDLLQTNFQATCIQQLCEFALNEKDEELGRVMAIFLASAMQTCHKNLGFGIRHFVWLLKKLHTSFTLCLEPLIVILSHFLLDCNANCYEPLLDLFQSLIGSNCNPYIWRMLQFSVLSIFSYSDRMEPSVISIVENVPSSMPRNSTSSLLTTNKYYQYLARSPFNNIQVALATFRKAQNLSENLPASNQSSMPESFFLLKCATFLHSTDRSALKDIVQHVSINKRHTNAVLTLFLKKLTSSADGKTKLDILYSLPSLAVDKMCVPRVVQIFEALSGSPQLQPVRLRLLTELWKAEDRVYPYVEKIILSEQFTSEEFLMAKAAAIQTICTQRADKYGAELLSVISDLLNSSLGKTNPNSATIATLALSSLVSLCKAEVVDLKSVWDLLAPKLLQDTRPSVVTEMCRLLALAPQFNIDNEEYDSFVHQSIAVLFRVSLDPTANSQIISTALKSLSCFRKEDFHLKCMPESCKEGLKIPAKHLPANKTEVAIKAEEVLDFVPGTCWIKLMDCYEPTILNDGFYTLISTLVQHEIKIMPIWIYRKAATDTTKRNEPVNYSSCLKEDSILAALVQNMQRICEINSGSQLRMSLSLKLLARPFERPLPPLDWSVMVPVAQQYNLEPELLEIVFSQVPHSFSAQSIAENVLISEPVDLPLALVALSHLGPICKTTPLKYVRDFLTRLFNDHQADVLPILKALHRSLSVEDPPIPSEVKQSIGENLMACWLPILPDEVEWMQKVADCFRLLTWTDLPSEPPPGSALKYVTILLLASADSEPSSKLAMDYLHKALQHILYLPRVDTELEILIQRCVAIHCKSAPSFLQQFMSFIQLVAMRPIKEHQWISSLLNIFCLLVLLLSDSFPFREHCLGNDRSNGDVKESIWNDLRLGMSCLFNQPQWGQTAKKSMFEWILSMIECAHLSPDERRHLTEVLSTLHGIDKESFLKVVAL